MSAITRTADWLTSEGLTTGWSVRKYRYVDKRDLGNNTIIVQSINPGSGNAYLQRHELELIIIGADPKSVVSTDDKALEIARAARVEDRGGVGIVKIEPQGNPRGPFSFEDGRPYSTLRLSVWTEDL